MNLPDELILERFRSFAGRAILPLRPITLVYGANNSGKSALLRALALLGASLQPKRRGAVSLPERAFPGVRFQDLAWQGEAGSYAWRLGLRWDDGPVQEMIAHINGGADRDAYINRLELQRDGAQPRWVARSNEDRQLVDPDTSAVIPLDGLVPATPDDLRQRLIALRGKVRWLAAVRAPIGRVLDGVATSEDTRLSDGSKAADLLVHDAALREDVARFYARLERPRSLELHEIPPVGHWLSLNPSSQPSWRVHINDTGEGMAQVLPVLVQAALTAREGGILAMEEPESHLHPSAQRALVQHLCALAAGPGSPRFILETHSRVFLLAVQIAVKNGFPADHVRVVWVDQSASGRSETTVIQLRPNGRLADGWPASALDEDLQLARELTRLGRAQENTA